MDISIEKDKKKKTLKVKEKTPTEYNSKLKNDVSYSLTINPKEQYLLSQSRYLEWYSDVLTWMKKFRIVSYCELKLITEISYPMTNGVPKVKPESINSRLHLHGSITFTDVVGWFTYVQPHLTTWCIYEIDEINCATTWDNYCSKDLLQWIENGETPFTEYEISNELLMIGSSKDHKKEIRARKNHRIKLKSNIDNLVSVSTDEFFKGIDDTI